MQPDAVEMQRAVEEWQRRRAYEIRPCLRCRTRPGGVKYARVVTSVDHRGVSSHGEVEVRGLVIGPLGLCAWPSPAVLKTSFDYASCQGAFGWWLTGRRHGAPNSRWEQCLRYSVTYNFEPRGFGAPTPALIPDWAKLRAELTVDDNALRVALDEWLALS